MAFRIGYHMVAFLPTANLLPDTDRCKDNTKILSLEMSEKDKDKDKDKDN